MPNLLKSLFCCCNANDSTPPPNRGQLYTKNNVPQGRTNPAVRPPPASPAVNPSSSQPQSPENSESSENSSKLSSSAHQFLRKPIVKPLNPEPTPQARSGSVEPESLKQGSSLKGPDSPQLSQHNHTNSNASTGALSRRDSPSRPHSVINNADIPMDYVNADTESKAEIAIKGRRQSASLLAGTQVTGVSPVSDENSPQSTLAPNPPTLVAHHPISNMGEAASGDPVNHDDITATGTVVDSAETAALYGENTILLEPQAKSLEGRKVLVLDLDETLVHSSFKHTWDADFVIPVEIENTIHDVYVVKRPGVDEFLQKMSQMYEVIVFTASVAKYGDPLLDRLDPHGFVHHRLFRESCQNFGGSYVKNLSMLGRPISSVIIVDNSPAAYAFHPFNAVPVSSWFSDIHDNELLDMVPFLDELSTEYVADVTTVLRSEW